jgi:DNA-directed RNA polymerase subunit H (RpoH/RPB5)
MSELSNVELNLKEIINILTKNIALMFYRRNYMKTKNFSDKIDHHKFLIVKSFSKKTYSQVVKDYKNAEIFTIYEFLEDIPAKEFIPEHILLNDSDKKELLETFGLNELGRINSTDIMARYYGAKLNDVFRIIRPNINSGTSIYYRLVIPGSTEVFS